MQWIYIKVLLIGTVWCQNKIPQGLQDLENQFAGIMPGIQNSNQSAVPSLEDVHDAMKKKCEKNGGANAFEKFGAAKDDLRECIDSNFNLTHIQEELDKSRQAGSMEDVFEKYCLKRPVVLECIGKFAVTVESCLEEEEKSSLKILLNITDNLANFACYKDGTRMAMFVAEGGFECIQTKKEDLEQCANKTFGHRIPDFSFNTLPPLVIDKEECGDYEHLQSCVVSVLKTCEEHTPANIVNALFKYIRRITPCKNQPLPTTVVGARQRVSRSSNNQQELNSLSNIFDQVKQKYEPHCLKNGGQIIAEKFREALDQVKNCSNSSHYKFIKKTEEVKGLPFDYLCKDFRIGIRDCLSTLTEKMGACLSPQEAYVPKFGIELYDSVFNFYCKDDARALKKFLGERDACLKKVHNSTSHCLSKTKHIDIFAKDDVITKSELCGDLKVLKNCFLDVAAQQCPSNSNSNEFAAGLSSAIYAPCSGSGYKILVSNSLLFLLLLVKTF